MKKRSDEVAKAIPQRFEVLTTCTLPGVGHVKRFSIIELVSGAYKSRHLRPLFKGPQRGNPDDPVVISVLRQGPE